MLNQNIFIKNISMQQSRIDRCLREENTMKQKAERLQQRAVIPPLANQPPMNFLNPQYILPFNSHTFADSLSVPKANYPNFSSQIEPRSGSQRQKQLRFKKKSSIENSDCKKLPIKPITPEMIEISDGQEIQQKNGSDAQINQPIVSNTKKQSFHKPIPETLNLKDQSKQKAAEYPQPSQNNFVKEGQNNGDKNHMNYKRHLEMQMMNSYENNTSSHGFPKQIHMPLNYRQSAVGPNFYNGQYYQHQMAGHSQFLYEQQFKDCNYPGANLAGMGYLNSMGTLNRQNSFKRAQKLGFPYEGLTSLPSAMGPAYSSNMHQINYAYPAQAQNPQYHYGRTPFMMPGNELYYPQNRINPQFGGPHMSDQNYYNSLGNLDNLGNLSNLNKNHQIKQQNPRFQNFKNQSKNQNQQSPNKYRPTATLTQEASRLSKKQVIVLDSDEQTQMKTQIKSHYAAQIVSPYRQFTGKYSPHLQQERRNNAHNMNGQRKMIHKHQFKRINAQPQTQFQQYQQNQKQYEQYQKCYQREQERAQATKLNREGVRTTAQGSEAADGLQKMKIYRKIQERNANFFSDKVEDSKLYPPTAATYIEALNQERNNHQQVMDFPMHSDPNGYLQNGKNHQPFYTNQDHRFRSNTPFKGFTHPVKSATSSKNMAVQGQMKNSIQKKPETQIGGLFLQNKKGRKPKLISKQIKENKNLSSAVPAKPKTQLQKDKNAYDQASRNVQRPYIEYTARLKKLKQLSRKRENNAQVMIGPEFQVQLPQFIGNSQQLESLKTIRRINLLKRIFCAV